MFVWCEPTQYFSPLAGPFNYFSYIDAPLGNASRDCGETRPTSNDSDGQIATCKPAVSACGNDAVQMRREAAS